MKAWMRALVWLGLGGGIGFFAGFRVGNRMKKEEAEAIYGRLDRAEKRNDDLEHNYQVNVDTIRNEYESQIAILKAENAQNTKDAKEAMDALREYLGGKDDLDVDNQNPEEDPEDAEMPMEDPVIDDPLEEEDEEEEIRQPHPEDFLPYSITRNEFVRNERGYGIQQLDYYTDDSVIFDPRKEEKWTHPEQLLGIGWKTLFISTGGEPIREVYIQNDTMGMLYKITRIDASFAELYEEE